jgi:hypothetical protein
MSQRIQSSLSSANSNKQTPTISIQTGIVVDVILDDTHPRVIKKADTETRFTEKNMNSLGGVVVRPYSDSTTADEKLQIYKPIEPTNLELPVIGEVVELIKVGSSEYYKRIPGQFLNKASAVEGRATVVYPDKEKPTNTAGDYSKTAETGTSTTTSGTSSPELKKLGKYFKHTPINNLKLYEGDKLIQSRFGQSIRFSAYNNVNNSFSPTILIRNRQNAESLGKLKEGDITEEDVNKDGTTIAITSNDYKLNFQPGIIDDGGSSDFKAKPDNFKKYPAELKGMDQLLVNSDRIIISSKRAEMIFYSKGNYGFISDGNFSIDNLNGGADLDFGNDVNITTKRNNRNLRIDTGDGKVFLNTDTSGKSPNTSKSTEPLVRGNTLKEILETLIDLIKLQVYKTPAGPTAVGPENRPDFDELKSKLTEMLSTKNFTE